MWVAQHSPGVCVWERGGGLELSGSVEDLFAVPNQYSTLWSLLLFCGRKFASWIPRTEAVGATDASWMPLGCQLDASWMPHHHGAATPLPSISRRHMMRTSRRLSPPFGNRIVYGASCHSIHESHGNWQRASIVYILQHTHISLKNAYVGFRWGTLH